MYYTNVSCTSTNSNKCFIQRHVKRDWLSWLYWKGNLVRVFCNHWLAIFHTRAPLELHYRRKWIYHVQTQLVVVIVTLRMTHVFRDTVLIWQHQKNMCCLMYYWKCKILIILSHGANIYRTFIVAVWSHQTNSLTHRAVIVP